MLADTHKLVDGYHAAERGVAADVNMAGEGHIVGQDGTVADDTIVRHVGISHYEAVFTNNGTPTGGSADVEGAIFANDGIVANFEKGTFASVFQILGNRTDYRPLKYLAVFTHARTIHDAHVRRNPRSVSDFYIGGDDGERSDSHILTDLRIGMDDT